MVILKKYGSQVAIGLVAAGMLCLILAFFIFPEISTVRVWVEGEERPSILSPGSLFAANWLLEAGIPLFPGDTIYYSGLSVPLSFSVPTEGSREIAYRAGRAINLEMDGNLISFHSSAATIGQALWEEGVILKEGDKLSVPFNTPLDRQMNITLITGRNILLSIGEMETLVYSAAQTVGAALADAGVALQGLDDCEPREDEPVPANGRIRILRVSEEAILQTSEIPYPLERVSDPEMAVGEQKLLQTGQNGVRTAAIRVRYADGQEISRTTEIEWVSRQPISQKTAYGSRVVVQTSPEGLDYWLAQEVYITSYRDTGSPTASGVWPYYGVIAVSPEWYTLLKGSNIYVPGYGVGAVLDVCPGCSGKPWIDVFIPIDDYVSWSRNETVYFLAPPPANFSGELP